MLHRSILRAFTDETEKLATTSPPSSPAGVSIPLAPLGFMGAGALGMLGAQRLFKDWKAGRDQRKLQSAQGATNAY
jgi:tellurite resistance protein TehA-like permease